MALVGACGCFVRGAHFQGDGEAGGKEASKDGPSSVAAFI
jgi:hypothetical protein